MKIIHCCFGNEHYLDTWGYQQNTLPLYHAKLGHETIVIASNDVYPKMAGKELIESIKAKGDDYYNGPVRVIRCSSLHHNNIHLQMAKGLSSILEREKPDIIFFHGSMNFSLSTCVRYRKRHPESSLFVDSHADILNVNANQFYRWIYFKLFWSLLHHYYQKTIDKYFGVTVGRCSFLIEYFHIKEANVELLPIGADVDTASLVTADRMEIRKRLGFQESDQVIVHGGKLDYRKGTVDLIMVYRELKEKKYPNLRLVLFGQILDERIPPLIGSDILVYSWLSRYQVFELFKMADLAVWPVHHTTLIEDCVASALPYLIRKTDTTQHLINSLFYLQTTSIEELRDKIDGFFAEKDINQHKLPVLRMRDTISYSAIAKRVVMLHRTIHQV